MPRRKSRRGPPYDLFGEIPVTWPEVWEWVEQVAGINRDSWRARYYVTHWNVPEKIRREKLEQDRPHKHVQYPPSPQRFR